MKATVTAIIMILTYACTTANAIAADTDLLEISSTKGESIKMKLSTLSDGKNKRGEEITSAIFQTFIKSTDRLFVNERYVVNADCTKGFGKLYALDTNGKFLFDNDFVLGGQSHASYVAEILCSSYASKKKQQEDLAKQPSQRLDPERKWRETIDEFLTTEASRPNGIDYRKYPEKMSTLDAYVKALANDEANSDKTGLWFLVEADRLVKMKFKNQDSR